MINAEDFGRNLRALRIESGLSQEKLADLMFVMRNAVSNWESGTRFPDITMLSRLASVLHVPLDALIGTGEGGETQPGIIVVEDEAVILKGFIRIISETLPDANAVGFQTGAEAVLYAESNRVDIAFVDIELFNESGLVLAEQLSAVNPRMNIIFLTGHTEYTSDALRQHCSGYLLKPLTPEKIKAEIAHLRYPLKRI